MEMIQYTALRLMVIDGRMVKPGETFMWGGKPPKAINARPTVEKPVVPPEKKLGGDTKPLDTQAAVKKKVAGFSEAS